MTPARFRQDRWFLLRYYATSVLLLAVVCGWLGARLDLATVSPLTTVSTLAALLGLALGGLQLILVAGLGLLAGQLVLAPDSHALGLATLAVPFGIMLGLYSAALMHVAAHNALRPRWLNRLVGEACALHQLIGYYGWAIPHMAHHRHADDPELDAHPPGSLGFFAFGNSMKDSIVRCLRRVYLAGHPDSNRVWRLTFALLIANRLLRITLWYLLLGHTWFVLVYVPSYVTQIYFYVHFNWATHRGRDVQGTEILNLDHGVYYRLMNQLLFGIYYHRNHHRSPALVDPRGLLGRTGGGPDLPR